MRRVLIALTLLSCCFVAVRQTRAGVYNLADKRAFPSMAQLDRDVRLQLAEISPDGVNGDVGELRGANDLNPKAAETAKRQGSFRAKCLKQVEELETKRKKEALTIVDVINLSACYIRLGRTDHANKLFEETKEKFSKDDPYQFLLLLNMAATEEMTGEFLERAILTQKQALKAWPSELPGWKRDDLLWYRRAEQFYLKWLQLRYAERQRNDGRVPTVETVDALFPKLNFKEMGLRYRAGMLPLEVSDDLQPDAFEIGVQLLLWSPNDARLYWLYGELLNAKGKIRAAQYVLNQLPDTWGLSNVRELMQHRSVITEAVNALPTEKTVEPDLPPTTTPLPPKTSDVWAPDWRQMGGGFLVGVIVTAFGMLQWREWARRRAERPLG